MFERKKIKYNYKLFGYIGSKTKYLNIINRIINKSKKNNYCEPFLGSGVIFLNLLKSFDNYFLAENDWCLYNMYNHLIFSKIKQNEFKKYFVYVTNKYKIETYEGFYLYREYFNKNLFKSASIEESFGIIILASNCINNIYRVGKNGFNSAFGNRSIKKFKLNRIEKTIYYFQNLDKSKINLFKDYKECVELNDCLFILDPPYYKKTVGYFWNKNDLQTLLKFINYENDYIYTDIDNEYSNKYFKNKFILNNIKNISPKGINTSSVEMLYYHIGE